MWSGEQCLGEYTACVFRSLSGDRGSLFIGNSIHTRYFGVFVEENIFNAFWIEMVSRNGGGMWFGMEQYFWKYDIP